VPGFTNRVLGRFVDEIFCAFPGTERQFPGRKVTVSGNPVRAAMSRLPSAPRDPFTIFIFGGSQGALGMNTLVIEALGELKDLLPRLRFIHQTGEKDYERVAQAHRQAGSNARVDKFIHEMAAAYAQSSLLICRAGSSTLSEIAAVGRAAILVPLPTATDNHQEKNARVFSDAGAAFLLTQSGEPGRLAKMVRELVAGDGATVSRMEAEVTRFHRPDSAALIVRHLAQHSSGAPS
jgi:UDP-N-acetylglucosamine--N-acetylmuramyl-(pentapeptide) pyrophosphoryl-undecaprenol N-acetylglucosamine transferase